MTSELPEKSIILYADDDSDDIELVRDAFAKYTDDVELVTVSNGIEALSFLKSLPGDTIPCLIILDINMPKLDGKETLILLRQLKQFTKVPTMLFTTSSQPIDKDFAREFGANFLTKPIDYTQMHMIANSFISHCSDAVRSKINGLPN